MTGASDRIARARADIAEVEVQRSEGELDDATAAMLIARYEAEIVDIQNVDDANDGATRGSRKVVGTLLLGGAMIAVAVVAAGSLQPRQDGIVASENTEIDLDTVTNDQMEAVIAANAGLPEVAAMRVALADRYFDEVEFSAALPHYLAALDGSLDAGRRARALSRIGWMSFVSGRSDLAESYLTQALATDGGYDEAHLFLGLVLLETCDPQGALDELGPLAADADVPAEIRADIEVALQRGDEMQASGECG